MHESPSGSVSGQTERREVITVSELNREARRLLESGFGVLWVEGEISNIARPGSGHWYFTLKDASAQVRCAMFRQRSLIPVSNRLATDRSGIDHARRPATDRIEPGADREPQTETKPGNLTPENERPI